MASGGGWAAAAGAIVGAGAGLESLVATSADMGSGSLIGSLTAMKPRNNATGGQGGSGKNGGGGGANGGGGGQGNFPPPVANPPFASDDLTGAKAVAEIVKRAKKNSAEQ